MTDTPNALVERIVDAAVDAANIVSHDGYYEIDKEAAESAVRAALATLPAAAPADVLEGLLLSAYRTGYRDGVEDHDAVLDVELLLREQAPEGFVQWRAEHQSELARLSAPQPPATAPADVVERVAVAIYGASCAECGDEPPPPIWNHVEPATQDAYRSMALAALRARATSVSSPSHTGGTE